MYIDGQCVPITLAEHRRIHAEMARDGAHIATFTRYKAEAGDDGKPALQLMPTVYALPVRDS